MMEAPELQNIAMPDFKQQMQPRKIRCTKIVWIDKEKINEYKLSVRCANGEPYALATCKAKTKKHAMRAARVLRTMAEIHWSTR